LSLANTTANGNWFMIGRDTTTASGTYNLADTSVAGGGISGFATGSGNLTVGKLWIGGAHFAGVGGTGVVNINTTGTITANSTQNFNGVTRASVTLGFGAGSNGTVNLENGTIEANSELWVGFSGNATFNQSGGTVESTEFFVVGRNSGAVANYNLSGGSVNAVTTQANAFAVLGSFSGSQGTLHVSGGTFTVASNRRMFVGEGGTGILNVSGTGLVTVSDATEGIRLGAGGTGNGTVNLNGGTIQTTLVSKGGGSGTFNFNGGTLKAGVVYGRLNGGERKRWRSGNRYQQLRYHHRATVA
jgi:T5SS/PEP-CTERM-associated repeat protein